MNLFIQMVPQTLMAAAPIIVCALGGIFSERSGVVNIALEGIMLFGAFTEATVCVLLEQQGVAGAGVISLIIATIAGTIFSLLLALSAVSFKADQTIAGTAINMLATGLTVYLCQIIFGQQRTIAFDKGISRIKEVPLLGKIPVIGDMFFKGVYPTIYLAVLLVIIINFILFKTAFGMRLRSCGEHPQASESMGISVYKTRYIGVMLSGALGGLAGAMLVLTAGTQFTAGTVHGLGFHKL